MPSLKDNFNELLERIRHGRELNYASFEPVYYLVFSPKEIIDVKRQTPAWSAKLRNDGWEVTVFSVAENIKSIFENAKLRRIWLKEDRKRPLEWERTNQTLANALTHGELKERLEMKLEELKGRNNSILLVTDLEALHPYMRIGVIEGQLQGKFCVPTVFFYPGERTGKTGLKFLGFYPVDGNYRSVHVGG